MKVLVLNCGSSSLKYQLIDMDNEIEKLNYEVMPQDDNTMDNYDFLLT